MRARRAIRPLAWALVAAGVLAPALRRRFPLPRPLVLAVGAVAPVAVCVVRPRTRGRDLAVCALNMWGYLAAYEMPHDDPANLEERVHVGYPIVADRVLGLGVPPSLRLQRRFARPAQINRFERVLVWCHWMWFVVPHGTLVYLMVCHRERFAAAAARMYAVFDVGAIFYWAVPTAPPWYAAERGELEDASALRVRRMMIEYGRQFWGSRWNGLYDVLGGNPLAAMPSLHFATSLMGAHLLAESGAIPGAIGWGYATLLGLALVYLGEHYAVDLLAGAVLTESIRAAAPRLHRAAQALSRSVHALEARCAP